MLHRIKKKDDIHSGKWNGLGGKVIPGETPEECIIREVYEESGMKIVRPELKGHLTFPKFSDGDDWYVFVFIATDFSGELINSPEGDLSWIDDREVPKLNLWEGDLIFLQWLKNSHFFSGKLEYQDGRLVRHDVVFYHNCLPIQD